MSLAASVCICTYNGAARIGEVLAALSRQTPASDSWETLVIDNASTDGSGELASRLIRDSLGGRGRVVREAQPGLSFARACAAREAKGEIICFLDDDNIPAPEWVESVVRAFFIRPKAGVIGGKVLPRWEVAPTPLAEAVAPFALAICDLGQSAQQIDGLGAGIVGAGMCVRAKVLRAIYQDKHAPAQVTGRTGKNLMSGEDLAVSIVARQMDWECWYDPSLAIEHHLPASRMQKDYLLRLFEGIGRGQAATRKVFDWKARSPLAWLIALKDFCRWQIHQWRGPSSKLRRQYPQLAADLHDLDQRLLFGRARQAFCYPRN